MLADPNPAAINQKSNAARPVKQAKRIQKLAIQNDQQKKHGSLRLYR